MQDLMYCYSLGGSVEATFIPLNRVGVWDLEDGESCRLSIATPLTSWITNVEFQSF